MKRAARDRAPVYVGAHDLAVWLVERAESDRSSRAIYADLAEHATELCAALVEALMAPAGRRAALARADAELIQLRVRSRIARDAGRIDARRARFVGDAVDELGRMVGGWRRAESRAASRRGPAAKSPPETAADVSVGAHSDACAESRSTRRSDLESRVRDPGARTA